METIKLDKGTARAMRDTLKQAAGRPGLESAFGHVGGLVATDGHCLIRWSSGAMVEDGFRADLTKVPAGDVELDAGGHATVKGGLFSVSVEDAYDPPSVESAVPHLLEDKCPETDNYARIGFDAALLKRVLSAFESGPERAVELWIPKDGLRCAYLRQEKRDGSVVRVAVMPCRLED
jgi:hypothetical protein